MAFVQDIYYIRYFFPEGILVLRSLPSEGRYFRGGGDRYFRDLLTPVTFNR